MQAMRGLAPGLLPRPPEHLPLTPLCRFAASQQLPCDSLEGWGGVGGHLGQRQAAASRPQVRALPPGPRSLGH